MIPTQSPAALVADAMRAWTPPPRLRLSGWADEKFYLSAESSAGAGPWHTYAYQREPMDAMTDPAILEVVWMKSARVGYTKMLNALIAYHMEHDPCAILLIQPTEDDAKGYSKEEIEPMLRDCASLQDVIPESIRRKNTMLHIRFRGGLLQLASSRSPSDFRRTSRRLVAGDEVDGYPPSAGDEGDPISLAKKRSEYFWNRKWVWGSTPTNAGSRIERLFLEGDQRRYYVPCTQCGAMDYLTFRREAVKGDGAPAGHFLRWTPGDPDDAHFVCRHCGGVIEHKHKLAIMERGEWRAHASFRGTASFHIWAAYSCSPNTTWADIAREYESAVAAGTEQLKTFVNTWLGETWKEPGDAPDWQILYQRRDVYELGSCPRGVLFLSAGVDVQKHGLVYEVVGWGRGKRSWSIDADVIPGDPADMGPNGPWARLDALLDRGFPHASGAQLQIRMLAVDSGDNTNTVYTWARTHPLSRVIAIKGDDRVGMLIGTPSKVDVTIGGRRVGYRMWRVSPNVAKSELYGWLRLTAPTDEARSAGQVDPPGYCRFPQYGEEYFKQLTAERLTPHRMPSGFVLLVWERIPGRENHWLDARNYARCAAALLGMDRFRDSDWAALEKAIGVGPEPPPTAPAPASPPATAAAATNVSSPAKAKRKTPWIQRRTGWIQRGR